MAARVPESRRSTRPLRSSVGDCSRNKKEEGEIGHGGEAADAPEGSHRNSRARRHHWRRAAERPAHASLRQRRLRQDAAVDGVPRSRRGRLRRERRVHRVRGDARGARRERSVSRIRGGPAHRERQDRDGSHPDRAKRDPGDRRLRPRRAVHPAGARDRHGRRETRRARHDRNAVRRVHESRRVARGATAPVPLAQGQGRHVHHHGRARRRGAHASRARGIRLRLRDIARPPSQRPGVDAAAADREVPRQPARYERVSVPDRRARHRGSAGHRPRTESRR